MSGRLQRVPRAAAAAAAVLAAALLACDVGAVVAGLAFWRSNHEIVPAIFLGFVIAVGGTGVILGVAFAIFRSTDVGAVSAGEYAPPRNRAA